jgi:YD repeat-containing protein
MDGSVMNSRRLIGPPIGTTHRTGSKLHWEWGDDGQPLSKDDRKRIAEHLYGKREWTMESIAKALNVTHKTISKDLNEFVPEVQNKPKGRGRPKAAIQAFGSEAALCQWRNANEPTR